MACILPTPELSWTYDKFTVIGVNASANQQAIFAIKNMLKDIFGWTIAGSSDAVTGAMDNVDRWDDLGDIVSVAGGGARSWVVLQSPGGQQILWDDVRFQGSALAAHIEASLFWSPLSDFAGGSNTSRPTSPNQSTIITTASWLTSRYSGSVQSVVHIMQSTDTLHTRLFTFRGGGPYAKWFIDTLVDPVTGLAIPQVSWINRSLGSSGSEQAADVNAANYATMHNAEQGPMRESDGGTFMACSLACEGTVSDSVGERISIPNELDACNPLLPTVVVSGTSGASGVVGRIPDVWFGRANIVNGTTYPGVGTHLFAQFSDIIVPWDGTLPQVV